MKKEGRHGGGTVEALEKKRLGNEKEKRRPMKGKKVRFMTQVEGSKSGPLPQNSPDGKKRVGGNREK